MKPRHILASNILLSVGVSVFLLGGLEGLAVWWEARNPPPVKEDYLWDWQKKWEGDFYTIRADVNGWPPWEEFNADGLRDRVHPVEKPAGTVRVAFLGDSVTLGDQIQPVEAYPQVLQSLLDEAGRPAEVLSVALWGWSTRQQRIAYERIARKYRPDEVVLAVCLNDIPELQNNLTRPPAWLMALHERSALVRLLVNAQGREIQRVEQLFSDPDAARVKDAYRRFFAEVRALRDDVQQDGAAFSVIVFPFRFQVAPGAPPPVAQRRVAAFCGEEGIRCLDLLPVVRELGEAAFVDYDHLSPAGARRVAQALLEDDLVGWPAPYADSVGTVADLAPLLRAEDPSVRAAAAWAAGPRKDGRMVPLLVAALEDPEEAVRREAARALGHLGGAADPARPALHVALGDPRPSVRWAASRALFHLGLRPSELPPLTSALASEDPYVRGFAAFSLGEMGAPARDAVPALAQALRHPDGYTRGGAVSALAKLGPVAVEAVPALLDGLASDDGDRRWKAARTLGRIGPAAQAAVPDLVRALTDPNEHVRVHAARALARIRPPGANVVGALEGAARDDIAAVRDEAQAALKELRAGPPAAP
jgi:HEAT repeat protein/lysophospholipase L1-like esterase